MTIKNNEAFQIDYDVDMDRFYIPVSSHYEIQTKGKGSSFRIANTKTHVRNLVSDEMLHPMLEDMARATNAEIRQLKFHINELRYVLEKLAGNTPLGRQTLNLTEQTIIANKA